LQVVLYTQAVQLAQHNTTARVDDRIVVSRHARGFASTDALVYDPWNDQSRHMDLA
jgi:hypothetical protein